MSQTAFELIDGLGACRVIAALAGQGHTKCGEHVGFRSAATDDCRLVYEWQCIPDMRRFSRNCQTPSWDEHKTWFEKKLYDPRRLLAIVEFEKTLGGLVRHDRRVAGGFEVSTLVPPALQGRGGASQALRHLGAICPGPDLWAYIKPDNTASLALFERCGYEPAADNWYVYRTSQKEQIAV